jgi:hypothetical protein
MKITCPECQFTADVAADRIPPGGASATCPKCSVVFRVEPSDPQPPEVPEATATITCPKCGAEQADAPVCGLCGIIFDKYRAAEERRQLLAAAAMARPVEPAETDLPPATFSFGAGRGEILSWASDGSLPISDLPRALRLAGALPGPPEWRRFLDGLALWLGALFLGAATIFFFAYNWQELGRFARFGIVELLLAAAVLASWRLGLERLPGKAALLVATLLVGALLALVGQTYQTGADPWELFATWALFVSPWVAIARFAPLWLLLLALVNLAISLYYRTVAGPFGLLSGVETLWWILTGVNTAALAIWELAASRGLPWLAARWAPRLVATASAGFITLLAIWSIVDRRGDGLGAFIGYTSWLGGAYAVYRHLLWDLYLLALGVLSLVVVLAVFLGHHLGQHGDAGALFLVGMMVLGVSAAGGWWLRTVAGEVET